MRGGGAVLEERDGARRRGRALRDEAATWTKDTPPALFVWLKSMRRLALSLSSPSSLNTAVVTSGASQSSPCQKICKTLSGSEESRP